MDGQLVPQIALAAATQQLQQKSSRGMLLSPEVLQAVQVRCSS
jgi:hypothetical protein